MKLILFVLLTSSIASAQTVHVEDDRIVYKGKEKVGGSNHEQLAARARNLVFDLNGGHEPESVQVQDGVKLSSEAELKLAAPDREAMKVKYIIQVEVKNESYDYRIDSVYLIQKEAGEKSSKISSKEVLKKMESSGPVAASMEKLLNEIDMRFQKVIDHINDEMHHG